MGKYGLENELTPPTEAAAPPVDENDVLEAESVEEAIEEILEEMEEEAEAAEDDDNADGSA